MGGFSVERSTVIDAPAHRVHELVNDFHHWAAWSPWEDLDPALQRTYTGPDHGVGARYSWSGNRKAGRGSMEIVRSTAEGVDVRLDFLKPFKSSNDVRFSLTPTGETTRVSWVMSGQQQGLMAVLGRFVKMDKLVGPDFEKGLARLKAVAEERG